MGVAPQYAARVAQPDLGQRVHGAAFMLDAWYPDAGEVLAPLPADGSHRIKCRGRFLRNESDAPPEQRAYRRSRLSQKVKPVKSHRAGADTKAIGQQASDKPTQHAFAGTGLTHHSQDLPGFEV